MARGLVAQALAAAPYTGAGRQAAHLGPAEVHLLRRAALGALALPPRVHHAHRRHVAHGRLLGQVLHLAQLGIRLAVGGRSVATVHSLSVPLEPLVAAERGLVLGGQEVLLVPHQRHRVLVGREDEVRHRPCRQLAHIPSGAVWAHVRVAADGMLVAIVAHGGAGKAVMPQEVVSGRQGHMFCRRDRYSLWRSLSKSSTELQLSLAATTSFLTAG